MPRGCGLKNCRCGRQYLTALPDPLGRVCRLDGCRTMALDYIVTFCRRLRLSSPVNLVPQLCWQADGRPTRWCWPPPRLPRRGTAGHPTLALPWPCATSAALAGRLRKGRDVDKIPWMARGVVPPRKDAFLTSKKTPRIWPAQQEMLWRVYGVSAERNAGKNRRDEPPCTRNHGRADFSVLP